MAENLHVTSLSNHRIPYIAGRSSCFVQKDVQYLRTDMRHQRQHDHHPFVKCQVGNASHLFQPSVYRWFYFFQRGVFTLLLEIKLDRNSQNLIEPSDKFIHRLFFYKPFALAPITSASCSKSILSLTGIPPTSVVGSTRPASCWTTCHASWGRCISWPGATWMSVPCV